MQKWIVRQQDIQDCGACTILSIIKYYGGYVPLETLRVDTFTDKTGTSAYNIIETIKNYGYESNGYKVKTEKLEKIK